MYRFPSLPPGEYTLDGNALRLHPPRSRACRSASGQTPRVDLALQVAGVAEQVQVTAEPQVLDMTSTKTATTITPEVIEQLPRGRTFNTLLQIAPGVRPEPKAGTAGVGGYQVDGASGSENVFVLDGVDVSNIRRASLGVAGRDPLRVRPGNADQERRVRRRVRRRPRRRGQRRQQVWHRHLPRRGDSTSSRGSSAERAPGHDRCRTVRTAALPPQSVQRHPGRVLPAAARTTTRTSIYGFTLGGPIVKDKLRFFVGYMPERYNTDRSINFRTARPAAEIRGTRRPRSSATAASGRARLLALRSSCSSNGSYFWNPQKTTGLLTGNDPKVAPPTSDLTMQGGYMPSNATTLGVELHPDRRTSC